MQKGKGDFMSKRKWLAGFSAAVLLVTTLAVGLVFQASAAITGGTMTPLTTQAEVDALGTSLIAGKTAQLKTGAQFMDGYGPEYMTDGGIAALNSDASEARIQWDNFDYGKTAATVYLWFDMGSVQTVNRLLICSKMANPYQLYNGQVFVGDTVDTLFADDAKVLSYDYGASGQWVDVATNGREVRPIMQFDLLENCQGRYIGFSFYKPYFGDMDWTNMEAGITVSELGVYYDPSINARASLIAGKEPEAVTTTQTDATNQAQVTGLTEIENGANLTDGSAKTGSLYLPGCYPFDYNANPHKCGQVQFYFDMGASYTVDQIDLTSTGPQHSYVYEGTVYVADSAESLFADANAAASFNKGYNGNTEKTLTLSAYKTGRYVGFALYSPAAYQTNWDNFWSGRVVLEEIAVYGEEPVSSLLTGKQPILASTTRTDAQTQGQVSGLTELEGDGAGLTDNNTSSGASLYLPGCSPFDYNAHAHQTGDVRVYFDLGETYRLNKAGIVSLADVQKYYIYRGTVYVGNRADTLFTEDNQAASFNYGYNGASKELAVDMNATGRYVGFSLYAPAAWETNWDNFWSGQVQIGELSVCGERAISSLISGKLPTAVSTTRTDAQTQAQVSGLTELEGDGAGLTDGTAAGTALYLPGCSPFDYNANAHQTGDVRVSFDLGETYQLNKAGIVSLANEQKYYVYRGTVYVSNNIDTLFTDANKAASFNYGYSSASKELTIDCNAAGRYVGFSLYAPAAWETNWDNFWSGRVQIGELSVYGERPTDIVEPSLITGKQPIAASTTRIDAQTQAQVSGLTEMVDDGAGLTDNTAAGTALYLPGCSPFNYDANAHYTGDARVYFDLGDTYQLNKATIVSQGDKQRYYIFKASVYVSDDADSLFDSGNKVAEFRSAFNSNSEKTIPLDMLSRVATGRYVGFSLYAPAAWECSWDQWWAGQVLVEELAVYGEKASGSSDTNLISGMKPVDSYLTNRLYPDRYHEGNSNGFLNELVIAYPERLTDGDRGTRASWTHQRTDGRIPTLEDRKLISMDTPWAVVIYHLGGTAEVTDILLTSTGEPGCAEGNYYIAGVDYYVGMTLDTLFDASNRVFTTNGEKTIEKNGEKVLDPSVDVLDRYIYSGELSTPKQGRYVALVVTRPDATPVPGWSEARVNEFEVFGTLKSRDETVTTSFSESTYGCTLTLSQLNYDDVDFFKNLSRLEVKRTAIASGVNQTVDKWLKADPKAQYVYTFTLYDKSGKAMNANDVGKRKITVTIPNQSGQALTLAQLNGSTLTRIVNAHVHKGKLLGENITGNWQFVPVVFETKDVIYNGIGAR